MVKRPKSPEPVEDSKFLAVVHPFPINANMELPSDYKEFMYWLASIVGKDYALGVYHKPSARGMVVAEVSKSFQDYHKLLGEHSWTKFLHKLTSEEKERKTRVYYSTYSSGRGLQKDGWKNILADDDLFTEFRPVNRMIKHPYPIPIWCDVPAEDPTNKRICRPLPVETKAPPGKARVPVPGSSNWISQKGGGKSLPPHVEQKGGRSQKGNPQEGNAKGKGKDPVNPDAWKTPIISPVINKSPSTPMTSPTTPIPPSKSAWSKSFTTTVASKASLDHVASPTNSFSTPRSISPASATAGTESSIPVSSPSISRAHTSPPPGLDSMNLQSPPGRPTNPLGSSSIVTLQHQFAATSISGTTNSIIASPSEGGYNDFNSDEDDEDDFVFPNASAVTQNNNVTVLPGEEPRMGKGPGKGKQSIGNVVQNTRNQKDDHADNLWSKVPQKSARTFRKVIEEEDICPVHGIVCSKGICSVMKKRKWAKEREEKYNARQKAKEKRKAKETEENEEREEEEEEEEVEKNNTPSVVAENAAGSRAASVVESVASTRKPLSVRRGDWGPTRERNAKKRGKAIQENEDDKLESATVSSARPTYGGPSGANSEIFSDADGSVISAINSSPYASSNFPHAPISPSTTFSSSTVKPTKTRSISTSSFSAASAVAYSQITPSVTPTIDSYSKTITNTKSSQGNSWIDSSSSASLKGKGKGIARGDGFEESKGGIVEKGKVNSTQQDKGKGKVKAKTWIEMMEEEDGSELGSLDF